MPLKTQFSECVQLTDGVLLVSKDGLFHKHLGMLTQQEFSFSKNKSRTYASWDNQVAVLMENNRLEVYDFGPSESNPTFSASFDNASSPVSRLFVVKNPVSKEQELSARFLLFEPKKNNVTKLHLVQPTTQGKK